MPTAATNTYSGAVLLPMYDEPESALIPVKLAASTVFAKGTVLGEVTATPGLYKAYASGSSDGSEVPKGILQYDCATDASSNVTFGGAATGGPFGETAKVAPMYYTGAFKTSELTGFDANAATKLGGHLINGSVADGVYAF
jgi:hypothetical protein